MTSTIKVNNIQNQCGANIANKCGSTVTLGASGDTITLACGASQTGFGRTGTVDWDTTPKTASFTAVNGTGYFINTTSGAVTMTMPSGSAGAIVSIQDYNKTFDTNALTVTPASGEKINGGTDSDNLIISTEGQGLTFVYVDSTVGWKTVHENEFTAGGSDLVIATGGTITTCGDYKIHTFTGPGTFCVSSVSACSANNLVSYVVAAGGGGGGTTGGTDNGAGGGAGGFREYKNSCDPYTASPLNGNPGGTAVTVTATGYPITVGGGGVGGVHDCASDHGRDGSSSIFSTITSAGGGGGGGVAPACNMPGGPFPTGGRKGSGGGSGGGSAGGTLNLPGGAGNSPPVSPAQGNNGGTSSGGPSPDKGAGGGGGATAAGTQGGAPVCSSGDGGAGATTSISGSPTAYAGGGGGAPAGGLGGTGGGGDGGIPGTTNTGGGGGGARCTLTGGAGGSGIVIIRYKFQ